MAAASDQRSMDKTKNTEESAVIIKLYDTIQKNRGVLLIALAAVLFLLTVLILGSYLSEKTRASAIGKVEAFERRYDAVRYISGTDFESLDMLMDIPLSVSVELGKSHKYIKDILDFNVGTIVVLDKMAGEVVDVVVNGKLIAKAEVVVIDDSYGARITDIVTPAKRLSNA